MNRLLLAAVISVSIQVAVPASATQRMVVAEMYTNVS